MSRPKRLRWPMHVHLSTLFAALFLILAITSAVERYRVSTLMIESSVSDLFKVINREANDRTGPNTLATTTRAPAAGTRRPFAAATPPRASPTCSSPRAPWA